MNNCIYIKENAVSDEACDRLIKGFHDSKWFHTVGAAGGEVNNEVKASTDLQLSFHHQIEDEEPFISAIHSAIPEWEKQSPGLYKQPEFNIDPHHNIQWYKPGEGFHELHSEWDFSDEHTARRMGAWMFYLNDVKEGGGTEFPHQDFIAIPKKGTLLCFPAQWTHYHRGVAAPNEDKYILTGWFSASIQK